MSRFRKILNKIPLVLPLLVLWLLPDTAAAEEFKSMLGDVPFLNEGSINSSGDLVNGLYVLSITLAAILVVIRLIWAGMNYMFSELVPDKADAKKDIRAALIGLLIVLGAVTILDTVNSDITGINVIPDVSLESTDIDTSPFLDSGIEAMLSTPGSPLFGTVPTAYSCGRTDMVSCEEVRRKCQERSSCVDSIVRTSPSPSVIVFNRKPPEQLFEQHRQECEARGGEYQKVDIDGTFECALGEEVPIPDGGGDETLDRVACLTTPIPNLRWNPEEGVCRQSPLMIVPIPPEYLSSNLDLESLSEPERTAVLTDIRLACSFHQSDRGIPLVFEPEVKRDFCIEK